MGIFKSTCPFTYRNCHMEMVNPYGKTFPFGDILVNPQMVTTSISKQVSEWTIPVWKRPSLEINFKMVSWNGIDSPFGDPNMETGSLIFWIQFPHGDLLLTVSIWWSPYGNGKPYVLISHMETVIHHFHMGICRFPFSADAKKVGFSAGDAPALVTQWTAKTTVPVSKLGLPLWKWPGRLKKSHLGTPCSKIEFVSIWGLTLYDKS